MEVDRNTKFFHSRTLSRRKQNRIEALKIECMEWCFDDLLLQQHTIDFYRKLYSMENVSECGPFPCRGRFSVLSFDEVAYLESDELAMEIKEAFFGMASLKAPRVDGLHAKFY